VLRSEVGRQTGVRHTPSLTFVADAVPENAAHIEDLLAKVAAADAEVHRAAAGAKYAGDADPYKAPRAEDVEGDDADR
jgi:ribosome-binding factor A